MECNSGCKADTHKITCLSSTGSTTKFDTLEIKGIFNENKYWGEQVSFSLSSLKTPAEWASFKFTIETWWTYTKENKSYQIDIYTTADNVVLRDAI